MRGYCTSRDLYVQLELHSRESCHGRDKDGSWKSWEVGLPGMRSLWELLWSVARLPPWCWPPANTLHSAEIAESTLR